MYAFSAKKATAHNCATGFKIIYQCALAPCCEKQSPTAADRQNRVQKQLKRWAVEYCKNVGIQQNTYFYWQASCAGLLMRECGCQKFTTNFWLRLLGAKVAVMRFDGKPIPML